MALSQGLMQEFSLDLLSLHFFFPALRVASCCTAPGSSHPRVLVENLGRSMCSTLAAPGCTEIFPSSRARGRQSSSVCFTAFIMWIFEFSVLGFFSPGGTRAPGLARTCGIPRLQWLPRLGWQTWAMGAARGAGEPWAGPGNGQDQGKLELQTPGRRQGAPKAVLPSLASFRISLLSPQTTDLD